MHIAFLTPEYPHALIKNSAGIGTFVKNMAVGLLKEKHLVTVFVYSQNVNEVFEDEGVIIHKIAYKKYSFLSWYFYRKQIQNYIASVIKTENINVLEAPDWTGITAFMKFKIPLVIRLHGSDAYFCHLEKRKQKIKNYVFEKVALHSADAIVSVSNFTAGISKKIFSLKKDIVVIHNGVDIQQFNTNDTQIIEDSIVYFGSIIRKKGLLELAGIFNEVVKQKPQAKLKLIGKDVVDIFERKSTLELFYSLLNEEAKANTLYIGEIPYAEITSEIKKAAVVVLPSFAEAFPMTWLEAMAMGKALVTSNIGWAKELMIDGETGYTEHPENHSEFASKIVKLLNDKNEGYKMGTIARKQIENNFATNKIIKKNLNYYKNVNVNYV